MPRKSESTRTTAEAIWRAGLAAVEPRAATRAWLQTHPIEGRVTAVAIGKAAAAMALGARDALAVTGIALAPEPAAIEGFEVFVGSHPIPDEGGQAAARAIEARVGAMGAGEVLLALISGGGSALLADPKPPLDLEGLQEHTRRWLRDGAPIEAINAWRIAHGRLKGGGLGRLAAPARVVTLVVSDVPDHPELVASGPTSGTGDLVEIGSLDQAIDAAIAEARARGWTVRRWPRLVGEAREVGARLARDLRESEPGTAWIGGGECTVTVRGSGLGGRCQEIAVAAALEGVGGVLLAAGTDGRDGPTDAAGGWATADLDLDGALGALEANDTHPWLDARKALFRTGATGTNVGDLVVGLR